MKPEIIVGGSEGFHNLNRETQRRLEKGKGYRDLSTVCVVPTRGQIDARVVENWMGLQTPMNNAFVRIFVRGMEVGAAYTQAVDLILEHPHLKDFKYMLTLEEDNMPPGDGLLKLYESIDEYQVVGGLYYTKGLGGQPMVYGNPKEPINFRPQVPLQDEVQECHGLGMGFTLWDLEIFKSGKLDRPWFQTVQEPNRAYTQDLHCFERVRKAGYRVASDNRVKVGHWDANEMVVW